MPKNFEVDFRDDDNDDVLREMTNKRQAPKLSPKLNQPTKRHKPESTINLSSISRMIPVFGETQ